MAIINTALTGIVNTIEGVQQDAFKRIFTHVDQLGIKQGVDSLGIDRYIEQCARFSATTGALAGGGGALTMVIGIPFDLMNMITQQIRVTLGVIYHTRGTYQISFDEFLTIMAQAMQIEAGITITKAILERASQRILTRMGSKTASRLIPIVGAFIGGATNYLFIKRMAESVMKMHSSREPLTVHLE